MINGLVSIIMPNWNTGRFIRNSIESVQAQTYKNWELIIVDDNSSDNVEEIVQSCYDERISFIKNKSNHGAAYCRNKAIRKARGEWIAFLDSDDLWMPEKLERMLLFMNSNKYVFAYHEYIKIDENSIPLGISVLGPKKVTNRMIYNYGYPGCLTVMYRANTIGLIQIKEIKKNNDYAILLKISKQTDCYLLEEKLGCYRVRKKSISHDKLIKKLKSHYDLFHVCDDRKPLIAFWFACRNIFYGVLKKWKYEIKE